MKASSFFILTFCLLPAALHGAPLKGAWRRLPGVVAHVFTHFPLELVVFAARLPNRTNAPAGMRWVAPCDLEQAALPSLMRKVVAHGLGRL